MTDTPPPLREVLDAALYTAHKYDRHTEDQVSGVVSAILASAEVTALQERVAALEAALRYASPRRAVSIPCMADLRCYRYDGHGGEHAYADAPDVWSDELPPGGYVCGVCGQPVESEPCAEHQPAKVRALLDPEPAP